MEFGKWVCYAICKKITTEQLSGSYLEKEEVCQKISSSLFSDSEQQRRGVLIKLTL